jgi:large subunit ribosomal protein L29
MENKEIIELTDKELWNELNDKKVFLTRLKLNHKVSDIENPMVIRSTRRTIAKIKTELSARKNNKKA